MKMESVTFAGTLKKSPVSYYFQIGTTTEWCPEENVYMPSEVAYIEKNDVLYKNACADAYGYFTIEEARKCYRALLKKGFKPTH